MAGVGVECWHQRWTIAHDTNPRMAMTMNATPIGRPHQGQHRLMCCLGSRDRRRRRATYQVCQKIGTRGLRRVWRTRPDKPRACQVSIPSVLGGMAERPPGCRRGGSVGSSDRGSQAADKQHVRRHPVDCSDRGCRRHGSVMLSCQLAASAEKSGGSVKSPLGQEKPKVSRLLSTAMPFHCGGGGDRRRQVGPPRFRENGRILTRLGIRMGLWDGNTKPTGGEKSENR